MIVNYGKREGECNYNASQDKLHHGSLKSFPKSISNTAERDISGAKTSPHSHNLFIGALNVLIMNQNPNATGQPKRQTARADCCVKTARNAIL